MQIVSCYLLGVFHALDEGLVLLEFGHRHSSNQHGRVALQLAWSLQPAESLAEARSLLLSLECGHHWYGVSAAATAVIGGRGHEHHLRVRAHQNAPLMR